MDLFAERGFLVADGKRMAVSFPQNKWAEKDRRLWLLSDYYPAQISMFHSTTDVTVHGDYFKRMACGQPEVTIEIKAHGVQSVPFEEGIKLFRNADSLSVNELLAIAYQKMDSR